MKIRKLIFAILVGLLAISVACSGAKKKTEKLVTDTGVFPRYLELIAEDTPYAIAAMEPVPESIIDLWIEKTRSIVTSRFSVDMYSNEPILSALYEEIILKLYEPKGIESLGLMKSPRFVFYGIGILPAFRMEISDGSKVHALIKRLETRIGVKPVEEKLGNQKFWSYSNNDIVVPFAIVDNELVIGFSNVNAAEFFTSYLLGVKRPAKSFAQVNHLKQVASEYGFLNYLTGFVNLKEIYNALFVDSKSLNSQITDFIPALREAEIKPVCVNEWSGLLVQMPRIVFGYDKLSETKAMGRLGLEVKNSLPADLAATKTSSTFFANGPRDSKIVAGFGFDVGKALNIVRDNLRKIQNNPFQCKNEISRALNEMARNAHMLSMAPPAISTLKGGVIGLRDVERIDLAKGKPNVWPKTKVIIDGYIAFRSDNPRALLDVLSLAEPLFSSLSIKEDLKPVALIFPPRMDELVKPAALLSPKYLALTSGNTTAADLSQALGTALDTPSSPFAFIRYDMGKIIDLLHKIAPENERDSAEFKQLLDSKALLEGETVFEFYPEERGFFTKFTHSL